MNLGREPGGSQTTHPMWVARVELREKMAELRYWEAMRGSQTKETNR